MTTTPSTIEYSPYSEWKPEDYLAEYYHEVMPDEQFALEFTVEWMQKTPSVPVALEFGCGPTVHHVFPVAPHAQEIHMAEYLANNRATVEAWLAGQEGTHDWLDFTLETLRLEGNANPTVEQARAREQLTRERVQGVLPGNAFDTDPLGPEKRGFYPLVTTFYCAEGATTDKEEWRLCIRNILSLVAPGGTLILSCCGSNAFYCVGDRYFPCASVSAQDILGSLLENGFTNIDIRLRQVPDHSEQGYSSVIFARAVKGDKTL